MGVGSGQVWVGVGVRVAGSETIHQTHNDIPGSIPSLLPDSIVSTTLYTGIE